MRAPAAGPKNKNIVWRRFDLDGTHYQKGKGLKVFVDGELVQSSPVMAKLELQL